MFRACAPLLAVFLTVSVTLRAQMGTSNVEQGAASAGHFTNREFFEELMRYTAAKVEWSRIVESRTGNPDIKAFAKTIDDQNLALAGALNKRGPLYRAQFDTSVSGKEKEISDQLRAAPPQELDSDYLKAIQKYGHKSVDLLESQSRGNTDPDVQTIAMRLEPMLSRQSDDARKLQKELK